jgi:methionyl-tRNA formyltransferase
VRAFAPTPGAFCFVGSRRLKILESNVVQGAGEFAAAPGTVIAAQGELLWVQTRDGVLALTQVQPEGKRVMAARDVINGRVLAVGSTLSDQPG